MKEKEKKNEKKVKEEENRKEGTNKWRNKEGKERKGERGIIIKKETTGWSKNAPNEFNKHTTEFVTSHMSCFGKLILK